VAELIRINSLLSVWLNILSGNYYCAHCAVAAAAAAYCTAAVAAI